MAADQTGSFDPSPQVAQWQALMSAWLDPLKLLTHGAFPMRYEPVDPVVQEIAILAAMHNMASMLRDAGKLKSILSAELAARSKELATN